MDTNKHLQTIDNRVISRIYGTGRGSAFTPNAFLDLGSRDAVDQARAYAESGVRSISVLTEQDNFGGCLADLAKIKEALPGISLFLPFCGAVCFLLYRASHIPQALQHRCFVSRSRSFLSRRD